MAEPKKPRVTKGGPYDHVHPDHKPTHRSTQQSDGKNKYSPREAANDKSATLASRIQAVIIVEGQMNSVKKAAYDLLGLPTILVLGQITTELPGNIFKVNDMVDDAINKFAQSVVKSGADTEHMSAEDIAGSVISTMQKMHKKATNEEKKR